MNHLETLLDDYVSADEIERLHLYLTHRTLRNQFIRIEMEELSAAVEKRPARSAGRWLERFRTSFEPI